MFTEEQQLKLVEQCKQAVEQLKTVVAQRDLAKKELEAKAELLQKGTEDILLLLAFIRSKGLKPPTTHYQA